MIYLSQPRTIGCYASVHQGMLLQDAEKQIQKYKDNPSDSDHYYTITEQNQKLKIRIIFNKNSLIFTKTSNAIKEPIFRFVIIANKPLSESPCLTALSNIALKKLGAAPVECIPYLNYDNIVLVSVSEEAFIQYQVSKSILIGLLKIVDD